ncbi:MAG: peptidylprolyl isomerase [Chitinophagaceae bacterium]|nr:MAG: peptidylprolyl isomerase [Chitinophagaceae bacterium]
MKYCLMLTFVVLLGGCSHKTYKEPHVLIKTTAGEIEVELYPEKAPLTVAAFLANIEAGNYAKASFYRVLKNEDLPAEYNQGLIQGGVFQANPGIVGKLQKVVHESPKQTGLSHVSGTISMARTTPGSATSEFFISIGDQTQFDSSRRSNPDGLGYAAFGKVVEGMDVVRKIQNNKSTGESFNNPILIRSIEKL